jgi:membrane associated rhomboid family serine protease
MVQLREDYSQKRIEEWALVLSASSIPYVIEEKDQCWILYVDTSNYSRAERILREYDFENKEWVTEVSEKPPKTKTFSGLIIGLLLVGIHFSIRGQLWEREILGMGSASAELILNGQWWRSVTALFLHADLVHVLSNAFACWVFCTSVVQLYGYGLGWFLILLSGAGGNLITAYVYQMDHVSIGASTAIFGAVGLLGTWRFVSKRRHSIFRKRAWIYIAGVVALLAFFGVGQRTDIAAHLAGGALGCILGYIVNKLIPQQLSKRSNAIIATVTACIILLSWSLAFISPY